MAIGTCERAASPVLLTACALLPRCRQPQLRAVGLDGHRALDISVTTGRRDVDTTVTRIRPPARLRALPHGPGGEEHVPVKAVPVSRARSSSRLRPRRRTARPTHHRVRPRRLRPGHRRHDLRSKHHRGLHAGAALASLSPRVHHITASRTTPAHTHPRSTHLHLHRTHLPLTSPPATRSPLPLHRPCPSSHVSHACAQPSQDKTFSSPTAVGETPGSSYQLHEDNNASAAAGQGATQDEPLAVRSITAHECEPSQAPAACRPRAPAQYGALVAKGTRVAIAMIAPASTRATAR